MSPKYPDWVRILVSHTEELKKLRIETFNICLNILREENYKVLLDKISGEIETSFIVWQLQNDISFVSSKSYVKDNEIGDFGISLMLSAVNSEYEDEDQLLERLNPYFEYYGSTKALFWLEEIASELSVYILGSKNRTAIEKMKPILFACILKANVFLSSHFGDKETKNEMLIKLKEYNDPTPTQKTGFDTVNVRKKQEKVKEFKEEKFTEVKSRSSKKLYKLMAIIMILIVALWYSFSLKTPERVVQEYAAAMQARDFEKAMTYHSESSRVKFQEDFAHPITAVREFYTTYNMMISVSTNGYDVFGDEAIVYLTLTMPSLDAVSSFLHEKMDKWVSNSTIDLEQLSEIEVTELSFTILLQALSAAEIVTLEGYIPMVKQSGQWKIDGEYIF